MNFESPARLNITGRYHRLPKRMTDDYESLPQAGTPPQAGTDMDRAMVRHGGHLVVAGSTAGFNIETS